MRIKLTDVRLSYPKLWKAEEFKPGDGKPRYSASFHIEPGSANDKLILDAIKSEAEEKFGQKAALYIDTWKNNSQKTCYVTGDLKDDPHSAGKMILSCHRQKKDGPPTVVDANRAPLEEGAGKPYGGCYVDAIVEIYAQTGENPGIRAGFAGVQFRRDGEAFGGGVAAKVEEFDDLSDGTGDGGGLL